MEQEKQEILFNQATEIARKVNQVIYDFDPYEYQDTVGYPEEDRVNNISDIAKSIINGEMSDMLKFLGHVIEYDDSFLESVGKIINELAAFNADRKFEVYQSQKEQSLEKASKALTKNEDQKER